MLSDSRVQVVRDVSYRDAGLGICTEYRVLIGTQSEKCEYAEEYKPMVLKSDNREWRNPH